MDDFNIKEIIWRLLAVFLAFIMSVAICGFIGALISCKSVRYVPVPEYHTEYKTKTDSFVKRDSVWVKDSVWLWMQGDTVYKERWHMKYNDRYVYRNKTDTVMKTDSVRVPYPVEKKLGKWEQMKIEYFTPLACLSGIIFVSLLWLIKRRMS